MSAAPSAWRPSAESSSRLGENGAVDARPAPFRVAELRGIVPALTDRETIDFDDVIAEAFADLGE